MTTDVGIWIDHAKAHIITLRTDHEPRFETIESAVEGKRKSTGHVRMSPSTQHASGSHNKDERWREAMLRQYFERVARKVSAAHRLYIFGPNGGRRDLEARVTDLNPAPTVVAVDAADHMTENQMVAQVRVLFADLDRQSIPIVR